MLDLTGANLTSYLIRIIKDAVSRSPRFRTALGEVKFASNNMVQYRDVQVVVKDVSTSGTRLSPDYFMCTQHGRAILAKVRDCDSNFIEWVREVDSTRQTPVAGVYYLKIDAFDDETNLLDLTLTQYGWLEGKLAQAEGSLVYLRDGINGTQLVATDSTTGQAVTVDAYTQHIYLSQPCDRLVLTQNGTPLVPLTDYWYQRTQDFPLTTTVGGTQLVNVSQPFLYATVVDSSDGYELVPGNDFNWVSNNTAIALSPWTPANSQLILRALVKVDPSTTSGTNPENILPVTVPTNVQSGEAIVRTNSGDYTILPVNGKYTLPQLLAPGDWLTWEAHPMVSETTVQAKKWNLNGELIPGLHVAIGDNVTVNDEAAIIVSPTLTETYEVFGSKENLQFTLEVRSNDLQTSSDLSEMLKHQLLVMRRENMEADGITIFEAPRSQQGQQRDPSGTAPTYVYTLSVSAACDWKIYMPLVTRVTRFLFADSVYIPDYPSKLQMAPRLQAFGAFNFIPSYR